MTRNYPSILFAFALLVLGTSTLTSAQSFTWGGNLLSGGLSNIKSMTVDVAGNSYITGYYTYSLDPDLGPGTPQLTSAGDNDVFICKYGPSGNYIWGKTIGGQYDDEGNGISVDAGGNVYVTGLINDVVDLDPGPGTANTSSSGMTAFVLKLNSGGNYVWGKTFEGAGGFGPRGVEVRTDASGNVIVTGLFTGTADFDPGAGTYNLTSVSSFLEDAFVCKLSSTGTFVWAKSIGNQFTMYVYGMDLDAAGNVYVTGNITDVTDFDPGGGIFNITPSPGTQNAYVWKLNANGTFGWAKAFICPNGTLSYALDVDASGNVITGGTFLGPCDFDPGAGTFTMTSTGGDAYLSKLDAAGNFVWAKQFPGYATVYGIATDATGNVYTTGSFSSTTDFDPGSGVRTLSSQGSYNAFISKLDAAGNFGWVDGLTGVYDINGWDLGLDPTNNLLVAGNFNLYADLDPCIGYYEAQSFSQDYDGFLMKLGSCTPSTATITQHACDMFIANGDTFTTSGVYTQTIQNAQCCDSVITWNLTVGQSTTRTINTTGCLHYTLNGQDYTSSGVYTQTLTNQAGCDSIITLNLTITTVNVAVTQSFNTLTAQLVGASYQWVDCNQGYAPISGATHRIYVAPAVGDYAVIVNDNGCIDTSLCYNVSVVGTLEGITALPMRVGPNPTSGMVDVQLPNTQASSHWRVKDLTGRTVLEQNGYSFGNLRIDLTALPAGTYLLEVAQKQQHGKAMIVKTNTP